MDKASLKDIPDSHRSINALEYLCKKQWEMTGWNLKLGVKFGPALNKEREFYQLLFKGKIDFCC